MLKKGLLVLICILSCCGAIAQNSNIDTALFQTWYLSSVSVKGQNPDYYYGEDVPKMIVYEDLSFYATDSCWEITGNFEEGTPFFEGDFGLGTLNYDANCVLGGSSGYVLELLYEFTDVMACFGASTEIPNELAMQTYFGFIHSFKNEITLSSSENLIEAITISPNPTSEILNINNLSAPIDTAYLYAMNGTLVKSYSTIDNQLNISEVPAGIYFLRITQDSATTVKRIVKE